LAQAAAQNVAGKTKAPGRATAQGLLNFEVFYPHQAYATTAADPKPLPS